MNAGQGLNDLAASVSLGPAQQPVPSGPVNPLGRAPMYQYLGQANYTPMTGRESTNVEDRRNETTIEKNQQMSAMRDFMEHLARTRQ